MWVEGTEGETTRDDQSEIPGNVMRCLMLWWWGCWGMSADVSSSFIHSFIHGATRTFSCPRLSTLSTNCWTRPVTHFSRISAPITEHYDISKRDDWPGKKIWWIHEPSSHFHHSTICSSWTKWLWCEINKTRSVLVVFLFLIQLTILNFLFKWFIFGKCESFHYMYGHT